MAQGPECWKRATNQSTSARFSDDYGRKPGFPKAGLAAAAGIHLRQIHRYESGEQQPALDVAQRSVAALGATLDELAGGSSCRVNLHGTWWAAWQTFSEGEQVIATQPVGL